jgi:acyl-CoA thioesterase-1
LRRLAIWFWLTLFFFLAGCTSSTREGNSPPVIDTTSSSAPPPAATPKDLRPLIVAFGDSLTAGLGVDPMENYPAKIQKRIDAAGYAFRVVNAGISGETSSQGLGRLDAILALNPAIVILEFGANDGLRGLPVEATRQNLTDMISRLQDSRIKIVLAGMQMPPNYGQLYVRDFSRIFPDIAKERNIALIPFFLDRVGGRPDLNQGDGMHPTASGYDLVVDNVWAALEPILRKRMGSNLKKINPMPNPAKPNQNGSK